MSHTFTTHIGNGEDRHILPVEVTYDYTPPEPRTWNHPGAPLEIEILSVETNGVEVRDELSAFELADLEDEAIEHLDFVTEDDALYAEASRRGIDLWATR